MKDSHKHMYTHLHIHFLWIVVSILHAIWYLNLQNVHILRNPSGSQVYNPLQTDDGTL